MADALDRLKNRQRPTVDTRDSSIIKSDHDDAGTRNPSSPDIQISTLPDSKAPPSLEVKNTTVLPKR